MHKTSVGSKLVFRAIVGLFLCLVSVALAFFLMPLDQHVVTSGSYFSGTKSIIGLHPYVFSHKGLESGQRLSLTLTFQAKARKIIGYEDLFQTADANKGARLELSPAGILAVNLRSPGTEKYAGCVFHTPFTTGKWHRVYVRIQSDGTVLGKLDDLLQCSIVDPAIGPAFNRVAIGSGFSITRPFQGELRDVALQYEFLDPRPLAKAVRFLALFLAAFLAAWFISEPLSYLTRILEVKSASWMPVFHRASSFADRIALGELQPARARKTSSLRGISKSTSTLWVTDYLILLSGTAALSVICFFQVLTAPLMGTDISANLLPQIAHAKEWTLANAGSEAMLTVAHQHGGWLPLSGLELLIWPLITTAGMPQLIQLASITINIATFACLCAAISRSLAFGWLATTMVILCFEFRKPTDASIAMLFHWPFAVELILLGALSLTIAKAHPPSRTIAVLASVGCFSFLIAYDKIGYPVALEILGLAVFSRDWTVRVAAAVVVGFAAISLAINISLGSIRLGGTIHQFVDQMLAGLPTIYRASGLLFTANLPDWSTGDVEFRNLPQVNIAWLSAFVITLSFIFAAWCVSKRSIVLTGVAEAAMTSWIVAATCVLIAPRGAIVVFGEAAPSVYVENFAVGTLLAVTIAFTVGVEGFRPLQRWRSLIIASCALLCFFVEYGNQRVDAYVIGLNKRSAEIYDTLGSASKSGVFRSFMPMELSFSSLYGFSSDPLAFNSGQMFVAATSNRKIVGSIGRDLTEPVQSGSTVRVLPKAGQAGQKCPDLTLEENGKSYGIFLAASSLERNRRLTRIHGGMSYMAQPVGDNAFILGSAHCRAPILDRQCIALVGCVRR